MVIKKEPLSYHLVGSSSTSWFKKRPQCSANLYSELKRPYFTIHTFPVGSNVVPPYILNYCLIIMSHHDKLICEQHFMLALNPYYLVTSVCQCLLLLTKLRWTNRVYLCVGQRPDLSWHRERDLHAPTAQSLQRAWGESQDTVHLGQGTRSFKCRNDF